MHFDARFCISDVHANSAAAAVKTLREEVVERKAKCIITIATCILHKALTSLHLSSLTRLRGAADLIVDFMTGTYFFSAIWLTFYVCARLQRSLSNGKRVDRHLKNLIIT